MIGAEQTKAVGELLREWRIRRHLSQLDLAVEAEISTRHLSFLETGRAQPSREMLLRLAEQLDVPLRERNSLLVAAGYAPIYKQRELNDPGLHDARKIIDLLLSAHEPYPALAVDRHWTLVASNRTIPLFLKGIDPSLLTPPVNVLRLSLHPQGLAPQIVNLEEWRSHLLARLRKQIDVSADSVLADLYNELSSYPIASDQAPRQQELSKYSDVAVPFQMATEFGVLSFLSTTTVFGTPVDITLSELALESFFPANAATADCLNRILKRVDA